MSLGSSDAFNVSGSMISSKSTKEIKLKLFHKTLEKNWRKEAINTKAYSSWAQTKVTNSSKDPYVEDKNTLCLKNRLHHKELTRDNHSPVLKTRTQSQVP